MSSVSPEHGFGLHWSFGCFSSTTIGTTHFAAERPPTRADAVACTVTVLTPTTCEKNPGAGRDPVTVIVSLGMTCDLKVVLIVPPPFFVAYCDARAEALAVLPGSAWAPASAAASTVGG